LDREDRSPKACALRRSENRHPRSCRRRANPSAGRCRAVDRFRFCDGAIFTAGRTRSQVALAEARREEATIAYQQTVGQAFREVSDALIGYRKLREFGEQQALLFIAAQDARRLAQVRYEGDVTSYLEVLDADTRLFDAALGLAQAELGERSGLVEIYRALGGGWN
jgi:outer membrane protein, multidrug efflux system